MDGYQVAGGSASEPGSDSLSSSPSRATARNRTAGVGAGFDHHLVKPVTPDALQDLLGSLPAFKGRPRTAGTAPD